MDLLEVGATLEKMQAVLSLAEEELDSLREESKEYYQGVFEQRLHNLQLTMMLVSDNLERIDKEVNRIDSIMLSDPKTPLEPK